MSRTGVEQKPSWRQVPKAVRQQVETVLGAPVRRAARIWGGYAPTPTYRLALHDGRRAFFKATNPDSNEFMRNALVAEERVYGELGPLLGDWMPACYAIFQLAGWHVMLLADLGPKSVPPWTPARARAISYRLAEFHLATLGATAPAWLSRPPQRLPEEDWLRTRAETADFHQLAALANTVASEVLAWLQMVSPLVERFSQQANLSAQPHAILHGDLRSDNLRLHEGQLYLFDWPAITVGRPEWDIVAFAQTVAVEGGPTPEQVMDWYAERFPVEPAVVESAIAWWLTFFADCAWREEIPGLPRVRRFQRQQLGMMLLWAARQWSLPKPVWAEQWL
ncbi:MAG TPA: phosphotransferase [Caldilineaceae bacterium]|nr:phosphotransferase [Caldilineaceae bacterium]